MPLTTEVILDAERRIADGGLTPYFKRMAQHRNVGPSVAALTRTWADSRVALDSRKPRERAAALTKDEVNRLRDEHYASPKYIFNNRCAVAFERANEIEAEFRERHWYRDWDRIGLLLNQLETLKGQVAAASEAYVRWLDSEDTPRPSLPPSTTIQCPTSCVCLRRRGGAHKGMAEEKLAEIIPNYQPKLLRFEGFAAEAPQFHDLYPKRIGEREALTEFV